MLDKSAKFFRIYPPTASFASINEKTTVGTTIAVITARDDDYGQNVRIRIASGNEESFFRLENGKNFAVLRLDRLVHNRSQKFRIRFSATDDGDPPLKSEDALEVLHNLRLNETTVFGTNHINTRTKQIILPLKQAKLS